MNKSCINETLNIGSTDKEITVEKVVKIIHKLGNKKISILKISSKNNSPKRRAPDMSKTKKYIKKV